MDDPRDEETEDTEEIVDEEDDEETFVTARDEVLDIFDNLSLKHNEQTPGDCWCFGCFLQVFVDADDLFPFSIVYFSIFVNESWCF